MNGKEHDAIVELTVHVESLCKRTEKYYEENKETHKEIIAKLDKSTDDLYNKMDSQKDVYADRITDCNKNFTRWRVFQWVIGFVIAGLMVIGGVAYNNHTKIAVHEAAATPHSQTTTE